MVNSELITELINMAEVCNILCPYYTAVGVLDRRPDITTVLDVQKNAPSLLGAVSARALYLTIQTKDMYQTLRTDGVWYANPTMAREKGTLCERDTDRATLQGHEPIYVYEPHVYLEKHKDPMGSELEVLRCQMSTDWELQYGRYLYLFSLPRYLPVATAHNASPYVKITPTLEWDSLLAVYELVRADTFWEIGCKLVFVRAGFERNEIHRMLLSVGVPKTPRLS